MLRESEKDQVLESYEQLLEQVSQERVVAANVEDERNQTKTALAAQLLKIETLTDELSVAETSLRTLQAEHRMVSAEYQATQASVTELQARLDAANQRCLGLEGQLSSAAAVNSFAENKWIELERGQQAAVHECSDAEVRAKALALQIGALESDLQNERARVNGLEELLRAERARRHMGGVARDEVSGDHNEVTRLSEEVSEMLALNETLRAELVSTRRLYEEAVMEATKWKAVGDAHAEKLAQIGNVQLFDEAEVLMSPADVTTPPNTLHTPVDSAPEAQAPQTAPRARDVVEPELKPSILQDLDKQVAKIREQEQELRKFDPSRGVANDLDLRMELRAMQQLLGRSDEVHVGS